MTKLPFGWQAKPLGDVAETQLGKMLNRSDQTGDSTIPYLRNVNVQWGRIDLADVKEMDIYPEERSKFTARPGDLLVCEGGESGRAAIWNGAEEIGIQNALHRIRPLGELETRYLLYYFEWQVKSRMIDHLLSGVTITHFTQEKLRRMVIQYPSLDKQRRIVEALDDHFSRLDKALAELNEGLIASDVFTRSLLKAAFGGQLTNKEASSEWVTTRIGDVVDFAPKKPNHLKESQEECSFLPMAAVQEVTGTIDLSQTISHEKALSKTLTFFNEGDVLFAKVTPCMENGKIAVARGLTNQMGYGSTEFHVLSPKESLLAEFLRYFLVSKDFRVNAATAMTGAVGLRRVPKFYLEEHLIPFPTLEEQQKVIDALDLQLSIVDQLKVSIHGQISKISALRRSLLQAAFTGKLTLEGISE